MQKGIRRFKILLFDSVSLTILIYNIGIVRLDKIKSIEKARVEKIFLCIAIPFIAVFIIIIPALQGWDETAHFLRAYQISEYDIIPDKFNDNHFGYKMPNDIIQMSDAALSDLIKSAQSGLKDKANLSYYIGYLKDNKIDSIRTEKYFESSAVYSPVSYLPQTLGIIIAKTIHSPLLMYIYIGRVFNALFFIGIVYFAIKTIPRGKWVILAVALLPTSVTAAASLSPDAIVIALVLLVMAYYIKGFIVKTPFSYWELIIIMFSLAAISLTKQAYFPLVFLFLFLPMLQSFGSRKRYLLFNLLFTLVGLSVTMLWYLLVSDVAKNVSISLRPGANINSVEQLHFILSEPFRYLTIVSWEIISHSSAYYTQLAGTLTWKGIQMPYAFVFVSYSGLLVAFLFSAGADKVSIRGISRFLTVIGPLAIALSAVFAIISALYLSFNEVGVRRIMGVQGRYLIPLVPLLLPAAILFRENLPKFITFNAKKTKYILVTIFVLQLTVAVIIVFTTNYIPGIRFPS